MTARSQMAEVASWAKVVIRGGHGARSLPGVDQSALQTALIEKGFLSFVSRRRHVLLLPRKTNNFTARMWARAMC